MCEHVQRITRAAASNNINQLSCLPDSNSAFLRLLPTLLNLYPETHKKALWKKYGRSSSSVLQLTWKSNSDRHSCSSKLKVKFCVSPPYWYSTWYFNVKKTNFTDNEALTFLSVTSEKHNLASVRHLSVWIFFSRKSTLVSEKYLVLRLGYGKQPFNHLPKPFSFNMILKPFETNRTWRLPPLTIFRQHWLDPVMMHKEFEVLDRCSVNVSIIFSFLIHWQVSEMAVSELPGNPNAVWTVRRHVEGNTDCALKY